MSKKMRLWMAGTVGVLMAGFMSVSVYALEEKDVIGTVSFRIKYIGLPSIWLREALR